MAMFFRILLILTIMSAATARVEAELRFPQTTVKLGKVRSGLPVKHRFVFINDGQEPAEIVEMRAGCGCLVPRLEKRIYKPAEKGCIPLEVNTLGESAGAHRWYIYLQYRQGKEVSVVLLQILAEVETEVTMQPAKVNLHIGKSLQQELRLTDLRSQPLTVTSLRCTSPHLKIQAAPRYRNPLGHWVVKITVQPAKSFPPGRHEEYLYVDTDDPVYQHLKIPITVVKRSSRQIRARPEQVEISGSAGQALPSRLLLIRASENEAVTIDRIEAEHPAITCRWAKGPGNFATVRVQIEKDRLQGNELKSTIYIHVSHPVRDVLSIPVKCRLLRAR